MPPAPALIERRAGRSSYSPEKSSAVRSLLKSVSSDAASRSSSASSSASGASWSSSIAASRSSARAVRSRQVVASLRMPSASRRTFCAVRPSSQKPGSWVWASISATRASLASKSKVPRGRPDPFSQVADGGGFHLVPALEILEQDRAQLDESQRSLASGDDGVHAGTISVVGADAAVAVTVQGRGVTATPAVTLTGYEIDKRCFLGLLHGLPLYAAGTNGRRVGLGQGLWGCWVPIVGGFWHSIRVQNPMLKREIGCSASFFEAEPVFGRHGAGSRLSAVALLVLVARPAPAWIVATDPRSRRRIAWPRAAGRRAAATDARPAHTRAADDRLIAE